MISLKNMLQIHEQNLNIYNDLIEEHASNTSTNVK